MDFVLIVDVEIVADVLVRDQLNAVVHMRSDAPENPYIHRAGMCVKRRTPCLSNAAARLEKLTAEAVVQNFMLRDDDTRRYEAAIQRF